MNQMDTDFEEHHLDITQTRLGGIRLFLTDKRNGEKSRQASFVVYQHNLRHAYGLCRAVGSYVDCAHK